MGQPFAGAKRWRKRLQPAGDRSSNLRGPIKPSVRAREQSDRSELAGRDSTRDRGFVCNSAST